MSNKKPIVVILSWMIKSGLWVIPFLPIYVSSSMLFPFITGKNFSFRIIVEILFVAWIAIMILDRDYRPRLTTLFKSATIFIMVLFLADLFSPNPYRAFFSNYERMEGFMMLSHLYLYFVMLVSVFKTKRDWLIFFHATLAASLIISYVAFLQRLGYRISLQGGFRVDSTIGNPTYLAAYLVFHIWLLLILMHKFWKKWWLVGLYATAFLVELAVIYFTATRGAILALVGAAIFLSIACFIFWKRMFPPSSMAMRKWAGAAFLILALIPVSIWFMRGSDFVRSSKVLIRLTSFSLQDRTVQSRFAIWQMSSKAVLERPLFGWGQENYYLVFQKYFDPRLYLQEPWFDRSHNVIFDWLISAGILGLLSYLAMLGSAVWVVFRSISKKMVHPFEGLMLASLFLTYFLQNIFVFDNLNTYLLFFGFLAYVEFIGAPSAEAHTAPEEYSKAGHKKTHGHHASSGASAGVALAAVSALGIFLAIFGYQVHVKSIRESKALISALQAYQMQLPADDIINAFKKALEYNTFGDTEVREQLSNLVRGAIGNEKYSIEDQRRLVEFSVDELRKEASIPFPDVKHKLFLGALMSRAISLSPSYGAEAEEVLQEAIRLSPGKQIVYFELAQAYLNSGKIDQSIEALQKALNLETSYQDAASNLLAVGYLAKRADVVAEAKSHLNIEVMPWETMERLANIYQQAGDYAEARVMYERLVLIFPENARYHASLASFLAHFGEVERAIREAETAGRLDPALAPEVKGFIEQLTGTPGAPTVEVETVP